MTPTDWLDELSFSVTAETPSAKPSEIERVVIDLFEESRDSLLRYSLSLGVSMHDSEEIVQEVFLLLFRHLTLGRPRSSLRGWIFRVTHNLALKRRIANQRSRDRVDPHATTTQEPCDPLPNPEEYLSLKQRQHRLLAVVDALPASDQSCLRLRAEGLRYREIASVLGISLGAVSISLTRSLARLLRADGR